MFIIKTKCSVHSKISHCKKRDNYKKNALRISQETRNFLENTVKIPINLIVKLSIHVMYSCLYLKM